jgi:simple sugar transport system permease protein
VALGVWLIVRGSRRAGIAGCWRRRRAHWFALTDLVPGELTGLTPYVATLLVLGVAAQRLRPPAADGIPYRRGSST